MKKDITELYCFIEDFCRIADEKISGKLLSSGKNPTRIPKIIAFLIIVRMR